jgi:hypothetical protein
MCGLVGELFGDIGAILISFSHNNIFLALLSPRVFFHKNFPAGCGINSGKIH